MSRNEIILIDSNIRRRAGISHSLTNMAGYVIPLEHYSEITLCWPKEAVILIEDAGGAIESLCRLMETQHKDLPFVAFSSEASPERRSAALLKGAGAYLPWPCNPEELKATLLSVAAQHHTRTGIATAESSGFPQLGRKPDAAREQRPQLAPHGDLWRRSEMVDVPQSAAYVE